MKLSHNYFSLFCFAACAGRQLAVLSQSNSTTSNTTTAAINVIQLNQFVLQHPLHGVTKGVDPTQINDSRFQPQTDGTIILSPHAGDAKTPHGDGPRVELKEKKSFDAKAGRHSMTVTTELLADQSVIVGQLFNKQTNKPVAFIKYNSKTKQLFCLIQGGTGPKKRVILEKNLKMGSAFTFKMTVSNGGKIQIKYSNPSCNINKTVNGKVNGGNLFFKSGCYAQGEGFTAKTRMHGLKLSHKQTAAAASV